MLATSGLALHRPHTGGQRAVWLHPARFQVLVCGRRWGKSELARLVAVKELLAGGEVWFISPTYKMSVTTWRYFVSLLGKHAEMANGSERMMTFSNGASLTIWSGGKADTMRGGGPSLAVFDEAAMLKDDTAWSAVVRPALSDRLGRALFPSTPRGRNWFWHLYNMGNDPAFAPEYKSWNFPSWNSPLFRPSEVESARRSLPERLFRQEYVAEFLEDAGGVFRGVIAAATLEERAPYGPGRVVFGVDWGRDNDFTVISVVDKLTGEQVALERFNQISWELQTARLKALAAAWQPRAIWAEENAMGGPLIEQLQRAGLPVVPFQTTAASKPTVIDALSLAIEQKAIKLLNDRVQTVELQAYEMARTRAGNITYNAPAGAHDDTVMALAIAWYGVQMGERHVGEMVANPFYD